MTKTKKQKVFIASEKKDLAVLEALMEQLSSLERKGSVELWHPGKITAGSEREKVILGELKKADLILLLISSSFIASEFAYHSILATALEQAKKTKVHLIPILAKSCVWEDTPLNKFVALPLNKIPITSDKWKTKEDPYVEIVLAIRRLLNGEDLLAEDISKKEQPKEAAETEIASGTKVNIYEHIKTGSEDTVAREDLLMQEGNALFRQKKYEAALQKFNEVIALNKQSERTLFNKGQSLRLLGRKEEALAAYELAIAMNPNWWRVYLGKGRLYEGQENWSEAIKWYQRGIKANPNIGNLYFQLAYVFHKTKRYQEAIEYYEYCIQLDPSFSSAYLNKGVLLRSQGKTAEAIALYQKAAALNRGNARIFQNLGNAYLELDQYQAALQNYEIALELNPNNAEVLKLRDWILRNK